MLERTYRAERFDDALAQVKRDLGPDAVILSTRRVSSGTLNRKEAVEVRAVSPEGAAQLGISTEPNERGSLLERRLSRMGVPTSAARTLARSVRRIRGGEEPATLEAAERALAQALGEEMIFGGHAGEGARVVALVGPTGVGKTTTVAKLAAIAALVDKKRVALVSIDQYRIGGTEQLERYADLIGVPMEVAHDGPSLEIALRRLGRAELVFVDTAGRSPRDIAALAAMAETFASVEEPVEVNLCISAAVRDAELSSIIDRHAVLRPTRLVATKLDEAVYHGAVVAAQVESGLPLAYFTTGQRVPEDIEEAGPERLATLLCGGEVEA